MKRYWLFKSEPSEYSFSDLEKAPQQTGHWEGVRNYQVRNFMRDAMKLGDEVLVYHSSVGIPAAMGTARLVREAYPDPTQFDAQSSYYDSKASETSPRWLAVDIQCIQRFTKPVTLTWMREQPNLADFILLRKGNRLSIVPVPQAIWDIIVKQGCS